MRSDEELAGMLTLEVAEAAGIDEHMGWLIAHNLRDALQALHQLCRDADPSNGVELNLFAALMAIARGEVDKLLLRERLRPEHRRLLVDALHQGARRVVEEEGRPRRAA
jgi:hypothetical protein